MRKPTHIRQLLLAPPAMRANLLADDNCVTTDAITTRPSPGNSSLLAMDSLLLEVLPPRKLEDPTYDGG